MTEEIMPRKDRSGKVWAFLSGCMAGVIGVFALAAMSDGGAASGGAGAGAGEGASAGMTVVEITH